MTILYGAIVLLVLFASTLALAEASISRMTPMRARALREQGHRNAALLEQIENDPPRSLNAVYLSVMFAQNGSAILVAVLAERHFSEVGIMAVSVAFTLAYFVFVEAMCKTFAILHSDRVALAVAPLVWILGRVLALPTRGLIGIANVLLPGKGLQQGPFATAADIRSLAETGYQEGMIDKHEKEMIHSVFRLGDRVAREVMTLRPDIVALEVSSSLDAAVKAFLDHGLTRLPVFRGDLDHTEGVLLVQDVLGAIHQKRTIASLAEILHSVRFVPESTPAAELLRSMQLEHYHLALVCDEYGFVSGLVTIENLVEQLVGGMAAEHDSEPPDMVALAGHLYRVSAALPITELNARLEAELPHDRWNTVGGLIFGLLGRIPDEGDSIDFDAFRFTAERIHGRRIEWVLIRRLSEDPTTAPAKPDS